MIDLPDFPLAREAAPGLIDFGSVLRPLLGGPVQRINRMGNRFRISIAMPPMPNAKLGRIWVARLIRGKSEGVRMPYPLLDFDPGVPGSIVVDGAGQSGSTLNVRGASANYAFREGQFFSIETGGKHHLYTVADETVADASGDVALPIAPMLRQQHADGDTAHFGEPMIEGLIEGEEFAWKLALERVTQIEFAIAEAQ